MNSIKGLKKAPSGSLGHLDFLAGQVTLKQIILWQNHELRQARSVPGQAKWESCLPNGQAEIQVFFQALQDKQAIHIPFCPFHLLHHQSFCQIPSVHPLKFGKENPGERLTQNGHSIHKWAWENSQHFTTPQMVFPMKWRLSNDRRNSTLMTHHFSDLGSASTWWRQISLTAQPLKSSIQISINSTKLFNKEA